MRRARQAILCIFAVLSIVLVMSSSAYAAQIPTQPEGPTSLEVVGSSRRTPTATSTIEAIAGNVTQLSFTANTVTQTWQAYFGNISGTVTLDDANNNTIYNWAAADPEGEIYASESQIDFTHGNVFCYDFDADDVGYSDFNTLAEYESILGLEPDDVDGINETFIESTGYDHFYVGSKYINESCPTTQMFDENGQKDPDKFQEVLLYDNTSNKLVYTALIEQDAQGFDQSFWDFEMIVGENGHDGDTTTTTYYFYVELE